MRSRLTGTAAQERMIGHLMAEVAGDIDKAGHARSNRQVARATSKAKVVAFERFLRVLIIGYGHNFTSCESLGEKHYRLYATWCKEAGLSAGTLGNAHSQLKHIFETVLKRKIASAKPPSITVTSRVARTSATQAKRGKTILLWTRRAMPCLPTKCADAFVGAMRVRS